MVCPSKCSSVGKVDSKHLSSQLLILTWQTPGRVDASHCLAPRISVIVWCALHVVMEFMHTLKAKAVGEWKNLKKNEYPHERDKKVAAWLKNVDVLWFLFINLMGSMHVMKVKTISLLWFQKKITQHHPLRGRNSMDISQRSWLLRSLTVGLQHAGACIGDIYPMSLPEMNIDSAQ